MDSLVAQHNDRLTQCEKAINQEINKAKSAMEDAALAIAPYLKEVKEGKLYAPRYKSFHDWWTTTTGRDRRAAAHILNQAKVHARLEGCAPISGKAAKELSKLPEKSQRPVWERLTQAGPVGKEVVAKEVKRITGGTSFDVEEIEAYKPPKNGAPTIDAKALKKLLASFDSLIRDLHKFGLYERNIKVLSDIRTQIIEVAA